MRASLIALLALAAPLAAQTPAPKAPAAQAPAPKAQAAQAPAPQAPAGLSPDFQETWIAGRIGVLTQLKDDRGANSPVLLGATAGRWYNDRWGLDLTVQFAKVDFSKTNTSGNESQVMLGGLLNVYPEGGTWIPYVKAGFALDKYETPVGKKLVSESKTSLVAGVGVQFRQQENWFIGIEALGIRHESEFHEWPLTVSVGYRF